MLNNTTGLQQEAFNSSTYSKEQNKMINKFMLVTGCKLWDTILYLNMADWDYKQAIGTQVLCKLSNQAKKKKSQGLLDRSSSFVFSKPSKQTIISTPITKGGFELERKRKAEELKSASCPNVMKSFKSNQQQRLNKKFIKRSLTLREVQGEKEYNIDILKKFLIQKPAPRWKHRLTAFTKLDPTLTEGWPSCFQDFNSIDENQKKMRKLVVNKKLFDLYKKIKIGISIKNLQRGLITFMEKQGFLNLSNMDDDFFLFISYDPIYF
ncbi:hypothetical protein M0813_02857 [Anaeramoeba flamelloides]|uniref:Uncharacterized protein n=1 Tax=Anaeramoeba flamelloides TaxID=1746091 RepID=A0ABQ8YEH9_9EUKA|nr:hypothetical protein M0813_02857 [Anaeramoeba flamelloides]